MKKSCVAEVIMIKIVVEKASNLNILPFDVKIIFRKFVNSVKLKLLKCIISLYLFLKDFGTNSTEICCNGVAHPKEPSLTCCGTERVDNVTTGCCAATPYNTTTHQCCSEYMNIIIKLC